MATGLAERLGGRADECRPGRPPVVGVAQVEAVVIVAPAVTPEASPAGRERIFAVHRLC
ncbi:hypothetical protein OHT68_41505 [Streptomyces canus]|uniref:hypothetical protein n=1 Tax=Streptomyces canus TaxID=58343 RepID=UPI002E2C0F8B|nr:hypothetical protein [Streptomyces canus]